MQDEVVVPARDRQRVWVRHRRSAELPDENEVGRTVADDPICDCDVAAAWRTRCRGEWSRTTFSFMRS
jgi:hypothetical protein